MSRAAAGRALAVLLAPLALFSCAGPLPLDDAPLGVAYDFEVAAPGLTFEASPIVTDDGVALELRAALAPADVVFASRGDGYEAVLNLSFTVRDVRGRETLASRAIVDTLRADRLAETRVGTPLTYTAVLAVPQGRMVAEAAILGPAAAPLALRRAEVTMPPAGAGPLITPPRLSRDGQPLVGAHVPRWRFGEAPTVAVDVVGASWEEVRFTLWRVRADTAAPLPPFWINPARGSLPVRGAAFDEPGDTLLAANLPEPRLELPLLEEGVYVIEAALPAGDHPPARRPLIVTPPDHPRLASIDDLIEALTYIAFPAEIAAMQAPGSTAGRRAAFDAFWGTLFDERRLAEDVMRRYFERVEEANRRFTAHQPGWRTDRGMILILFGPPEAVERTTDGETWHYAYGRAAAGPAFNFEYVRFDDAPWPLGHYLLQRAGRFETATLNAVRQWRRGLLP